MMNLRATRNFQTRFLRSYSTTRSRNSSAQYCLDLVKKCDYENFVAILLLKGTARSSAFAIRSLNVEVASVAERITQKISGQARLQFWKDTIEKCFSEDSQIPQQPIALEIRKAVSRSNLTKRYFHNLIQCRYDYLSRSQFQTLDEMEKYSENAVSNVLYLILEGCGVKNVHADHVASHLGKAQGLINFLRTFQISSQLNFIPIPQEILLKYTISEEEVLRHISQEKLGDCVFEIASRANQHLSKARSLLNKVPQHSIPVFLPAITIDAFLRRLQVVDYNIFHPSLKRKPLFWIPKLMWYNLRNKF